MICQKHQNLATSNYVIILIGSFQSAYRLIYIYEDKLALIFVLLCVSFKPL